MDQLERLLGRQSGEVDIEAIDAWLDASGLNLSYLASWDRLYRAHGVSLSYRKEASSGSLEVMVRVDAAEHGDDSLLRYIVEKLNNAVLILGGRHSRVFGPARIIRKLERTLRTDKRITECYGDDFRWDLRRAELASAHQRVALGASRAGGDRSFGYRMRNLPGTGHLSGDNPLVVGMDVGGSRTKVVVMKGDKILHAHTHRLPISQQASLQRLEDELIGILRQALKTWNTDNGPARIGISWAGPVSYGRIMSPIKLTHCIDVEERFSHFSQLEKVVSERLCLPTFLVNDGKAAALAVANATGRPRLLCLGVGTTVAAGFVDSLGRVDSDICELTAATLNMDREHDRRVSRHASVKFGLPHIVQALGYPTEATHFSELSDRIFKMFQEHDPLAQSAVGVLAIYLAETVAMSFDYLKMDNLVLFGGVAKNSDVTHAVMTWIRARYPEIQVENIAMPTDLEYLSARGSIVYAMLGDSQRDDGI